MHSHLLTTQTAQSQPADSLESREIQLDVESKSEHTEILEAAVLDEGDLKNDTKLTQTSEIATPGNDDLEPVKNEHLGVYDIEKEDESVISEDSFESLNSSPDDGHIDSSHDVMACAAEIAALKESLVKSEEEILSLRAQLEEKMSMKADEIDENVDSYELKLEEMRQVCVVLQDRVYQSETAEKQLREKLKLAEYTINDLESSENHARENLEVCRKSETEVKKSLSSCQKKVRELKEIILDKDVNEINLAEKVQWCIMGLMNDSCSILECCLLR